MQKRNKIASLLTTFIVGLLMLFGMISSSAATCTSWPGDRDMYDKTWEFSFDSPTTGEHVCTVTVWGYDYGGWDVQIKEYEDVHINSKFIGTTNDPKCNYVNPQNDRGCTDTYGGGPDCPFTGEYRWDHPDKPICKYYGPSISLSVSNSNIVLSSTNNKLKLQGHQSHRASNVRVCCEPINKPPKANAGPDQVVNHSSSSCSALVTLDGSGSTDDGYISPLTYNWIWVGGSTTGVTPKVTFILGTRTVNLTVYDGQFYNKDTVNITVQDKTPPNITCPPDVTVWQESRNGTVVNLIANATDICDSNVSITSNKLAIYPVGTTTVTFIATDDFGNNASCSTKVTVLCMCISSPIGDTNGDGCVDEKDLTILSSVYGSRFVWNNDTCNTVSENVRFSDFNCDGKVDKRDLVILMKNFRKQSICS